MAAATLRRLLRRGFRRLLRASPRKLRTLAVRLPFSRFHRLPNLLFDGEECISWRGVNICVNPGEVHGYYPYFLDDYSGPEIDQLIELCRGAKTLADIGANTGMFSLAVAQACPGLEVFGFEPDSVIVRRFQHNLNLNPHVKSRICCIAKAVADVNGELLFERSSNGGNMGIGRIVEASDPKARSLSVSAVRLDTFFEGLGIYPTIVKIDVEGFELQVLRGMTGIFRKDPPKAVLVEVHGWYFGSRSLKFKSEVKAILEAAGYQLYVLGDQGTQPCGSPGQWPERIHVLALR